MITTQRYVRKPFEVDAIRVTDDNMAQVADWCMGDIVSHPDSGVATYIHVKVERTMNERQTKAFVGDWVLYSSAGFKVYTNQAFERSFDKTDDAPRQLLTTSEKLSKVSTPS